MTPKRITYNDWITDPDHRINLRGKVARRLFRSGDCFVWSGTQTSTGYGRFLVGGRAVRAHRLAYILWVGPIEDGALVLHQCGNRLCCKPLHLRQGTSKDNAQDRIIHDKQRAAGLPLDIYGAVPR